MSMYLLKKTLQTTLAEQRTIFKQPACSGGELFFPRNGKRDFDVQFIRDGVQRGA